MRAKTKRSIFATGGRLFPAGERAENDRRHERPFDWLVSSAARPSSGSLECGWLHLFAERMLACHTGRRAPPWPVGQLELATGRRLLPAVQHGVRLSWARPLGAPPDRFQLSALDWGDEIVENERAGCQAMSLEIAETRAR
jgi:hypothetical protein